MGASFAEFEDGSKFMDSQINPLTGKRKRGRPRKLKPSMSQDYIDVGSDARMSPGDFAEEGNSRSNLEDDLQYSSDDDLDVEDEEDWQEVDNENITVTVEEQGSHFSADDQVAAVLIISSMGLMYVTSFSNISYCINCE